MLPSRYALLAIAMICALSLTACGNDSHAADKSKAAAAAKAKAAEAKERAADLRDSKQARAQQLTYARAAAPALTSLLSATVAMRPFIATAHAGRLSGQRSAIESSSEAALNACKKLEHLSPAGEVPKHIQFQAKISCDAYRSEIASLIGMADANTITQYDKHGQELFYKVETHVVSVDRLNDELESATVPALKKLAGPADRAWRSLGADLRVMSSR
jgi:hypothetical protein